MSILISQTYQRWDQEAIEAGDTDDKGYHYQAMPVTFRELVELMQSHTEPSCSPHNGERRVYLTDLHANQGTREYFEEGIEEQTSIHLDRSNSDHAARYWRLAMVAAGIIN